MSDYSVEELAQLARLELTEEEKETLNTDLGQILKFVETIQEVKVQDVEVMSSINHLKTVKRSDQPRQSLDRQQVLSEAPQANAGFFKVPQVLE